MLTAIWSVSNSSPVHVFEPFFCTSAVGQIRLKDRAIFDGSIFNADPHKMQVMWRRVYNDVVWLYESYLWIERYL